MKPARTKILKSFEGDCASSGENSQGRKKTELCGMYHLTTSEEKYCLNFYLYARDDENEEIQDCIKLKLQRRRTCSRKILSGIILRLVSSSEDDRKQELELFLCI